ncbi:translocation protein Sec62 [Hamiltosporidium tvaerminnensis]|uniref:Translocation protein SEC62 n=2 Tax=Hamiltosporidium TaxID=1176354 RepID=A0A4Q9L4Z5_9MICR|nr:Translocation protein S62 [Hamiltosporidium tvaerminnensis]TBT99255.1 translocation protein Sec62 [Hamiltosporidium tvaerminnensis]TBU01476.1 translocation protein Sec62 [Hamiltosporidium magnivora]TBU01650.1 translocation protein Sec62 [Hamiltosporidium magnivora]TBU19790.1 translocation protein Sec62 [Hamiltosporidium tvaerminnensis]
MDIKKFEKYLRKLPTEEKILNNEKRVSVLKGQDIFLHLKKQDIQDNEIQSIMDYLISQNTLVRVVLSGQQNCMLQLSKTFKKTDFYIWVTESTSSTNLIISLALIFLSLALVMYQVWPSKLRRCTVYVAYPLMAFVVFLIVLGILRLIIFSITFFTNSPGIWLFPNLFADVGFVDSFIPVWSYHGVDTKPKKNSED